MKEYFIYITTNLINGKQYIGQHQGYSNDKYLGSGVNLIKAIKKYGKENFKREILEFCKKEELDLKEQYWIKYYNAYENENFYNLSKGGQKGDGWEAARRYFENHPEEREQIYKKNIERLREWEKQNPDKVKQNINKMINGSKKYFKEHPEERERIMKQVNLSKEKWQAENPEQHQKQIKEWRIKGSEANSIKVICLNTGEIFNSISEAGRKMGVPQANISKCLKGERKSAGKMPNGDKISWKRI